MNSNKPLIKLALLLTMILFGVISNSFADKTLEDPTLDKLLVQLKADYGVSLHYTQGPEENFDLLNFALPEIEDRSILIQYVLIFIEEINKYPKNFFCYNNFKHIFFVKNLFYNQKPSEGLFTSGKNFIFFDFKRSYRNQTKQRHSIHHELYHMIGAKHEFWKEKNLMWENLNRPGFTYDSKKYDPHSTNPINSFAPPEPGFITHYAMASSEEDRAEMFSCMMMPQSLKIMKKWAKKDKILQEKIEMMKAFLKAL